MHPLYALFRRQGHFILIGLSLALVALLTLYHNGQVSRNLYRVLHTHRVLQTSEAFLSALKDCETGQRGYLLTGKEAYLAPFQEGKAHVHERLLSLRDLTLDNPAQQQRLEEIAALTAQKLTELELTISLRKSFGPDSALSVVTSNRGKAVMDQIRTVMQAFTDAERELLGLREGQFEKGQSVNQLMQAGLLLLVVASLAFLLRSLQQERVARKSLFAQIDDQNRTLLMNTDPDRRRQGAAAAMDEGAIVAALIANLRSATQFVLRIGQGQYEADLHGITPENLPANEHNLSGSLLKMRQQLICVAEEDKRRNWATEGLARFAELLRTETKGGQTAADLILHFLIRYLEANQGALFEVERHGAEADSGFPASPKRAGINMIACYAYDRKKHLGKTFAAGEGLVGQCVQEGDTIYLTEVPREYVSITSGLGGATPTAILIVPLKLNEKVYGVVELASFKRFEPYQVAFLEKLAESLASAMATFRMQQQTRTLLEESQQQAEMLRAQEEEMRQGMEELQATQEEMRRRHEVMEGLLEEARQKEIMMQEQEKMMRRSMEETAALQKELFTKDQQQRQEIERLKAAHRVKEQELEELLAEMKVNEQDLQQNEDRFRKVLLQLQQQEAQLKEKSELINQLQHRGKD